jgi:hypothetical protein
MRLGNAVAALCGVAIVAAAGPRAGAQELVTSFAPAGTTDTGVWFEVDVRPGGAASIEDLTGEGGNLENDQPLPIGAAKLTTADDDNTAKAEVGVIDGYGMPQDVLASLQVHYAYHKVENPGQGPFAAPSIKLTFLNTVCDDLASGNDCFGTLVYEPTWNQPGSEGSSAAVPLDTWTSVAIDADTGVFWWTGGFGAPNTAGGPPLRTLNDWAAAFSSDFQDAQLFQVSIGVGTFNAGQIGYFDDVQITHSFDGGYDAWYDFEPGVGPPTDKDECKRNGWRDFNNPTFKNQGECVRFVVLSDKPAPPNRP